MKNKLVIILALLIILSGCANGPPQALPDAAEEISGLTFTERVELSYADQFVIDRYEGGYSLIHVADGEKYLVTPEDGKIPADLGSDVKIIRRPLSDVYMAATAVMGLFDALGGTGAVRFSSVKADGWYIDGAREAMERGEMLYAGKYSLPDYELLLSEGCADLYSPKTVRASMGSFFNVNVMTDVDAKTLEKCADKGFAIYGGALHSDSIPYTEADFTKPCVIGIGNEANGIGDDVLRLCQSVKIPIMGKAESLNAGVAAAVLMYEAVT